MLQKKIKKIEMMIWDKSVYIEKFISPPPPPDKAIILIISAPYKSNAGEHSRCIASFSVFGSIEIIIN